MDRRVFLKNAAVSISTPAHTNHADLASGDQRLNLGQKSATSTLEVESTICQRNVHFREDFIRNDNRVVDDFRKQISELIS